MGISLSGPSQIKMSLNVGFANLPNLSIITFPLKIAEMIRISEPNGLAVRRMMSHVLAFPGSK